MSESVVGIIGGSGLYQMNDFELIEARPLKTPFGDPSDSYMIGRLAGKKVVFLPRHGRGHRISPSEINYRANIYGMKSLGVNAIISVSAVGSLREEINPGHFVIIDQFIDRTKSRASTFFENGIVAHVPFAEPICSQLGALLYESCLKAGVTAHRGGTYVCMEGPAFSTRAESHMYRSWKADVIGMTNLQEAKLAREAGICFGTIALSTDYDCWKEGEAHVDVAKVVAIIHQNVGNAQRVICELLQTIQLNECACQEALNGAIMTQLERVPEETKRKLHIIAGKYLQTFFCKSGEEI